AMIGTHIRFQLRSAWRDVARAHGRPAGEAQALAGRPWGYTVAQAQQEAAAPADTDPDPAWGPLYPPDAAADLAAPAAGLPALDPALLAACAALEDAPRHLGIHCG